MGAFTSIAIGVGSGLALYHVFNPPLFALAELEKGQQEARDMLLVTFLLGIALALLLYFLIGWSPAVLAFGVVSLLTILGRKFLGS